jgi:virginiamycin B lyase
LEVVSKTRRRRTSIALILVLLCVLPIVATSLVVYPHNPSTSQANLVSQQSSSTSPIKEYPIPTLNSGPNAIVYAPNQVLWFVQYNVGKIGELFPLNGTVKEFNIAEAGASPASLAIDRSGNIWFTDQKVPSIWVLYPSNSTFRQYQINTANSTPVFVLADSTNKVWFTDTTANYLGQVDPATGTITNYQLPTSNSGPAEIAAQNGTSYLWVTESFVNKIARFDTTTHVFREFTPSVSLLSPVGIAVDKNGNIWVSEHGGSSVAELIPSNSTFRKYPTSQPTNLKITAPATIALDPSGQVWFVEHFSNKVGRLNPVTGEMNEFVIPTSGLAYSLRNALDPSGNFWFTEYTANQIGMIEWSATSPVTITSTSTPIVVNAGQSITSQVSVSNDLSNPVNVRLNVTSTFTTYGQTSSTEVALSNYTLTLAPNQPKTVTATITPDSSLSSGIYAAGVEATYGNTSVIGTVFLQVHGNPILGLLLTYLPFIVIAAAAVLLVTGILIKRRRVSSSGISNVKLPIATIVVVALTILAFAVQVIPDSAAKCVGLPPPPPGSGVPAGPDYFGLALDIGSLAFFALVAYLLLRDRHRKKGRDKK